MLMLISREISKKQNDWDERNLKKKIHFKYLTNRQRRSEGFLAPGRPPPPWPPQQKFVIHQNLRNRWNCSQNLAIWKQMKIFSWAIF